MIEDDLSKIRVTQNTFYSNIKKNALMKETQKIECAELVLKEFAIEELISKTIYIGENSNKFFISYPFYKTYAAISNYQLIVDQIIQFIFHVLTKFTTFEIHINLESFTTTALQRNLCVFNLYYESCCIQNLCYDQNKLDRIVVYNTPKVINFLSTLIVKFTDKTIKKKIVLL